MHAMSGAYMKNDNKNASRKMSFKNVAHNLPDYMLKLNWRLHF